MFWLANFPLHAPISGLVLQQGPYLATIIHLALLCMRARTADNGGGVSANNEGKIE